MSAEEEEWKLEAGSQELTLPAHTHTGEILRRARFED
jgi:hypothetical protein